MLAGRTAYGHNPQDLQRASWLLARTQGQQGAAMGEQRPIAPNVQGGYAYGREQGFGQPQAFGQQVSALARAQSGAQDDLALHVALRDAILRRRMQDANTAHPTPNPTFDPYLRTQQAMPIGVTAQAAAHYQPGRSGRWGAAPAESTVDRLRRLGLLH